MFKWPFVKIVIAENTNIWALKRIYIFALLKFNTKNIQFFLKLKRKKILPVSNRSICHWEHGSAGRAQVLKCTFHFISREDIKDAMIFKWIQVSKLRRHLDLGEIPKPIPQNTLPTDSPHPSKHQINITYNWHYHFSIVIRWHLCPLNSCLWWVQPRRSF